MVGPSERWTGKDGSNKYTALIEFRDDDLKRKWQRLALEAVRPHLTTRREEVAADAGCPF